MILLRILLASDKTKINIIPTTIVGIKTYFFLCLSINNNAKHDAPIIKTVR